jgi:thioredoxin 1
MQVRYQAALRPDRAEIIPQRTAEAAIWRKCLSPPLGYLGAMQLPRDDSTDASVTVVALCAEWCGTCREFRPVFDALAAAMPAVRFLWVDIEDEPDIIGDMEIATFPTLGVLLGDVPLHFGPSEPLRGVVERLLRGLLENPAPGSVATQAAQVLLRAAARRRG